MSLFCNSSILLVLLAISFTYAYGQDHNIKILLEKPVIEEQPSSNNVLIDDSRFQSLVPQRIVNMFQALFNNELFKAHNQAFENINAPPKDSKIFSVLLLKSNNFKNEDSPKDLANFVFVKHFQNPFFDFGTNANNDELNKEKVHLLGGKTDPDNSPFFQKMQQDTNDNNDDHFKQVNPIFTGSEDIRMNQPVSEQPQSWFDKIKNIFSGQRRSSSAEEQKDPSKCMMFNFMRMKASVYYRTIIHLLFFTGLVLFVLLVALISIRSLKRRRALRYYSSQNMHVSTIETKANEASKKNRLFLFRLGNLRTSYAQKQHTFGEPEFEGKVQASFLIPQAPPAYDQIVIGDEKSSLTNSNSVDKPTDSTSIKSFPPDYDQK